MKKSLLSSIFVVATIFSQQSYSLPIEKVTYEKTGAKCNTSSKSSLKVFAGLELGVDDIVCALTKLNKKNLKDADKLKVQFGAIGYGHKLDIKERSEKEARSELQDLLYSFKPKLTLSVPEGTYDVYNGAHIIKNKYNSGVQAHMTVYVSPIYIKGTPMRMTLNFRSDNVAMENIYAPLLVRKLNRGTQFEPTPPVLVEVFYPSVLTNVVFKPTTDADKKVFSTSKKEFSTLMNDKYKGLADKQYSKDKNGNFSRFKDRNTMLRFSYPDNENYLGFEYSLVDANKAPYVVKYEEMLKEYTSNLSNKNDSSDSF